MNVHVARAYIVQAIALLAALALIYPGVFLRGEVLLQGSHLYDYAPWSHQRTPDVPKQNPLGLEATISVCVWYKLTDDAFARGELPLWNPYQFIGAPLLANYQTSVFYPPRLVFRLFDDTYTAMTFYFILRFWSIGMAAFLAGRTFGLVTPFANLFSLAFTLAGYNVMWTYYPPPDAMSWLPFLAAATEYLLNKKYMRGFALMTVGMTLSILSGHPSTVMMGSMGVSLYAAIRLLHSRGPALHAVKCASLAAGSMALSLAVGAVQLLPFAEYLREMALYIARFEPDGVAKYRYSIFDLMSAWNPRLLGTEFENTFWGTTNHTYLGMLYVGAPIWAGALILFATRRSLGPIRARMTMMIAAAAACVYCATDFPGAGFVQNLPVIRGTRPAYFLAFPTLAVPLAGAFALQCWMQRAQSFRNCIRAAATAMAVSILVLLCLLFAASFSAEFSNALNKNPELTAYIARQCAYTACVLLISCAILALSARFPARATALASAFCVLLVTDQVIAAHGLFGTTPRAQVFPENDLTRFLRSRDKPCRVRIDTTSIPSGIAPLYGIEESFGYDAVYPRRLKPFVDDLDYAPGAPTEELLACAYSLFPESAPLPEGFVRVAQFDGIQVAQNTLSMPRARLVASVETFASSELMFAKMRESDFSPATVLYTDEPIDFTLPPSDGSSAGDAVIEEWRSQFVRVRATANKECVLVLADGFYPGWEATIDGAPATIFPAYHLFRGVHVPKGEHVIEFAYRPASFRYGMIISIATLAISCSIALLILWRQRRGVQSILT